MIYRTRYELISYVLVDGTEIKFAPFRDICSTTYNVDPKDHVKTFEQLVQNMNMLLSSSISSSDVVKIVIRERFPEDSLTKDAIVQYRLKEILLKSFNKEQVEEVIKEFESKNKVDKPRMVITYINEDQVIECNHPHPEIVLSK
jgi:hypothetical protein